LMVGDHTNDVLAASSAPRPRWVQVPRLQYQLGDTGGERTYGCESACAPSVCSNQANRFYGLVPLGGRGGRAPTLRLPTAPALRPHSALQRPGCR
jgi:hypothetical protein